MKPIRSNKRKLEIKAGVAFFMATLAYATGNSLLNTAITTQAVAQESSKLALGSALEVVNTFAVIVIGLCLWALLKPYKSNLANGYLISRIVEGFTLAIGALMPFFANTLSETVLIQNRETTFFIAMLVLGLYSTYFFIKLIYSSFVPKWLTLLGIVGYIGLTVYSVTGLAFGQQWMWLFVPGGLFEVVFPVYLIVKGTKISH
jgi:Ca2+/Na+ antiporter